MHENRRALKEVDFFRVYMRGTMAIDDGHTESERFIPTRETLLSRLKDLDDHQSWRRFFDTYWKLIYSVAIKAGLSDAEAQDVVQETIISVSRNIGNFQYDRKTCSFKTWLMRATHSRISNQFRRQKKHAAVVPIIGSDEVNGIRLEDIIDESETGLEAIWEHEWEKNVIDAAIERVKRRIPAEQFHLFDFAVLREWPTEKVAVTFGVGKARVYLAKHRISKLVHAEARRIEEEFA